MTVTESHVNGFASDVAASEMMVTCEICIIVVVVVVVERKKPDDMCVID